MGLNVRIKNLSFTSQFNIEYRESGTTVFSNLGLFPPSTNIVTIPNLEFNTIYEIKITNQSNGEIIYKSVHTHDSKFFDCYDKVGFNVISTGPCTGQTFTLYDTVSGSTGYGNVNSIIGGIPRSYRLYTGNSLNISGATFIGVVTTDPSTGIIYTFNNYTTPTFKHVAVFLEHGDGSIENNNLVDSKKQGGFEVRILTSPCPICFTLKCNGAVTKQTLLPISDFGNGPVRNAYAGLCCFGELYFNEDEGRWEWSGFVPEEPAFSILITSGLPINNSTTLIWSANSETNYIISSEIGVCDNRQGIGECTKVCGETFEGFGYLYNWYTIGSDNGRGPGGIVNTGQTPINFYGNSTGVVFTDQRNQWRVPTKNDWDVLIQHLTPSVAGGKLKSKCSALPSTRGGLWTTPNSGATNQVNFMAVPGGGISDTGISGNLYNYGSYWTSTENNTIEATFKNLSYNNDDVTNNIFNKNGGFSIRLVRDVTTAESSLSDGTLSNGFNILPPYIGTYGDGNEPIIYLTVKIGNQVWTAQNLVDAYYNDNTEILFANSIGNWESLINTGGRCNYGFFPWAIFDRQTEPCRDVCCVVPTLISVTDDSGFLTITWDLNETP